MARRSVCLGERASKNHSFRRLGRPSPQPTGRGRSCSASTRPSATSPNTSPPTRKRAPSSSRSRSARTAAPRRYRASGPSGETVNVRRWADETGDAWVLGMVRAAVGLMLFLQGLSAADELVTAGYFGDRFHLPLIPEAMVPPRTIYLGIVAARILLAVLVT